MVYRLLFSVRNLYVEVLPCSGQDKLYVEFVNVTFPASSSAVIGQDAMNYDDLYLDAHLTARIGKNGRMDLL
jgi:hypothetical protein